MFTPFSDRYDILHTLSQHLATDKKTFFLSLAEAIARHVEFDRLAVHIYDDKKHNLDYMAPAKGLHTHLLDYKGGRVVNNTLAEIALMTQEILCVDNLFYYQQLPSVSIMVNIGLKSSIVIPLSIDNIPFASMHLSFGRDIRNKMNYYHALCNDLRSTFAIAAYGALLAIREPAAPPEAQTPATASPAFFRSPVMRRLLEDIHKIAGTDVPVLLTGETGTGKNWLARYIHAHSQRQKQPFVQVSCPALSSSLFESEMFGHVRGAFTGAHMGRLGRLEAADGGTLFLDEISEMPLGLQGKLLQVLQDRRFERVGDNQTRESDFRLITASNRPLGKWISEGKFREDLYYRMGCFHIHIPPLRDRKEDIPAIVDEMMHMEARRLSLGVPAFGAGVMDWLTAYPWPGNLREIENFSRRALILRNGEYLDLAITKTLLDQGTLQEEPPLPPASGVEPRTVVLQKERDRLAHVLKLCGGRLSGPHGAAAMLGIPRSSLQYRLAKHGLAAQDFS